MRLNSLQDVLVEEIGDLRSAEEQLIQALPLEPPTRMSFALRSRITSRRRVGICSGSRI